MCVYEGGRMAGLVCLCVINVLACMCVGVVWWGLLCTFACICVSEQTSHVYVREYVCAYWCARRIWCFVCVCVYDCVSVCEPSSHVCMCTCVCA